MAQNSEATKIPENDKTRILALLLEAHEILNAVPRTTQDKRGGPSFIGQVSYRLGELRRTIERGTLDR